MKNKKVLLGVGAALAAAASVVTLGLIKKQKGKDNKKKEATK